VRHLAVLAFQTELEFTLKSHGFSGGTLQFQ
jgi:hypothetical protein